MKLLPIDRNGQSNVDQGLPPEALAVMEATAAMYRGVGFVPPWICYIATQDGTPVGTCGFKSAPREGRVEIAYFTFPAFEGRGIASEMAAQLISLAATAAPSIVVAAQTLPERNASHRILEKHGFTCVGPVEHPEDGTVLEWQRACEPTA